MADKAGKTRIIVQSDWDQVLQYVSFSVIWVHCFDLPTKQYIARVVMPVLP